MTTNRFVLPHKSLLIGYENNTCSFTNAQESCEYTEQSRRAGSSLWRYLQNETSEEIKQTDRQKMNKIVEHGG